MNETFSERALQAALKLKPGNPALLKDSDIITGIWTIDPSIPSDRAHRLMQMVRSEIHAMIAREDTLRRYQVLYAVEEVSDDKMVCRFPSFGGDTTVTLDRTTMPEPFRSMTPDTRFLVDANLGAEKAEDIVTYSFNEILPPVENDL